jgi:hypothetical protein
VLACPWGDRNRNARLARLRVLQPQGNAIVGIDLAGDKQAAVVTDHDSRVLARGWMSLRAWELGGLLGLALVCVQPLLVYRAREAEGLTSTSPTRKTQSSSPG